jgi:hypothetical protein
MRPREEDLEGVRGEPRLGIGQLDPGDENGAQDDEEDIAGLPAGDGSGYERWHHMCLERSIELAWMERPRSRMVVLVGLELLE